MVFARMQVGLKKGLSDPAGLAAKKNAREELCLELRDVRTVDVFYTSFPLAREELRKSALALSDPVLQDFSSDLPLGKGQEFDWLIEVGFLPGVTDNLGRTAKESLEFVLGRKLNGEIFSSRQYLVQGALSPRQAGELARHLSNPLLSRVCVLPRKEWEKTWYTFSELPIVREKHEAKIREVSLEVSDPKLAELSRKNLLSLSLEEMKAFRQHFRRREVREEREGVGLGKNPTDAELEAFAQTQSEHCKHKIFRAEIRYKEGKGKEKIPGLFKTYIQEATEKVRKARQAEGKEDPLVSVFSDNAGMVRFSKDWNVCFKVETHNSPSALDPYGGALTGIVGVNRDILGCGLGAKPVFNTDVFCFGSLFTPKNKVPKGVLLPQRVFAGVRRGVEHGGNQIGIPTVNGALLFDECYLARPLVYVGTGGLIPATLPDGRKAEEKRARPGDKIVMVGGRIGKDGIHGATFSSVHLEESSPSTAVQIGAPIVQKRAQDFLLEARDRGFYTSITDNGAGGLSSSVGEMALQSNGAFLQLSEAPLKYHGLDPWEILLSESQERMTVAVKPERLAGFLKLAGERGTEATVLGEFNDSGKFHVKYGEKSLVYLDLEFLHHGLKPLVLEADWKPAPFQDPGLKEKENYTEDLLGLLAHENLCSREGVIRQYDHEVMAQTIVKPLMGKNNDGPSDAAVVKPLPDSWRGLAVGNGLNPYYGQLDTYWMAMNNADECVRNLVAVGADPCSIFLLDNFCWPSPLHHPKHNPDGKKKLGQLVRAAKGLHEYCTGMLAPLISGKDSMSNDKMIGNQKFSVLPTLLVSGMGFLEDARKAVTLDAKKPGDLVYGIGETRKEMGGSHFLRLQKKAGGRVPEIRPEKARSLYLSLHQAMRKGLVESCHDCSEGGLAVSLAETLFSGELGARIELGAMPRNADVTQNSMALFSESASRFVVTIAPENRKAFEKAMTGQPFGFLGTVQKDPRLEVTGLDGKKIIHADVLSLKRAWKETLEGMA